jgi:hypothetical protein
MLVHNVRHPIKLSSETASALVIVVLTLAPFPLQGQDKAQDKGQDKSVAAAKGKGRGPEAGPPGPVPHLTDGKPDLTGIWNGQRIVSQDGPAMLPWAEKLLAQRATTNYADDLEARCLPGGPPRAAPYHTSLVSTPKLVLMLFEGNTHMFRQFFVDGSDHPKNLKPTWYGDSRAHWDGDTLVVDTIGYNDKFWFDFDGHPHSEMLHTIERYTRTDAGTLVIETTIDDPVDYTKPFKMTFTARTQPNGELTEYICQENQQDAQHLQGPASLN